MTLSILFILSVVLGYYKDVSHMSEYCFVSGLLVGITFFISYLHQQKHEKPLNACIYLACMVDIFIIFIATVSIGLNLEGAFWFIHIINTILLVIYWFVFCDQRMMNWKGTGSVVIFPLLYMLFAFVLFKKRRTYSWKRIFEAVFCIYCATLLCMIEILYASAQTIKFDNAEDFSIENADRLLYNADQNILYWGDSSYQHCLDYTKMDGKLQAHKEEILREYGELSALICDCFHQ